MKKILLLSLCLVLLNIGYAQNKFEKGFIVTLSGDTLHGMLRDRKEGTFLKLYRKVRFRPAGKKLVKKYSANQIKAYSINNQLFESINRNALHQGFFSDKQSLNSFKDHVFLKVIVKGTASYYQQEWVEQGTALLEEIDYIKKKHDPHFIRSTQGLFGLKKRKVAALFNDCPPLQSKIKNKEIVTTIDVVQFYNNWISENYHKTE